MSEEETLQGSSPRCSQASLVRDGQGDLGVSGEECCGVCQEWSEVTRGALDAVFAGGA